MDSCVGVGDREDTAMIWEKINLMLAKSRDFQHFNSFECLVPKPRIIEQEGRCLGYEITVTKPYEKLFNQ